MKMIEDGAHILVFPYPAQGHMLSLLDLTHQLATRGLSITIVVTPKNLPLLHPLLSKHPTTINTLVLPFPTTTSSHHNNLIPPGVENFKDLPPRGSSSIDMILTVALLREPLLKWFKTHPSPPVAIISDMFLGWTHHLACQLSIPRYVFSPSGAMALSVIYSLWQNCPKTLIDDEIISFPEIPNSPKYPWWQLSPIYRNYLARRDEGNNPDQFEIVKDGFLGNVESYGLVINTFEDLEWTYLDYLKRKLGHERVWSVGPLLPPDDDAYGHAARGGSSVALASELSSWLDGCEDGSVLYVCFGSQLVLTNKQMEALALGLEKSKVRFIWCMKKGGDDEYGMIPSGFEDRVAGRGLVVTGWVPQVVILRHRAVGGFLTHCGWNSVLESLVAGVPMLAWPMSADQFANASLLVDELKVAVRLCEGINTVPNSHDICKQVKALMTTTTSPERTKAIEFSNSALKAIQKGGDSFQALDEFALHLATKKHH